MSTRADCQCSSLDRQYSSGLSSRSRELRHENELTISDVAPNTVQCVQGWSVKPYYVRRLCAYCYYNSAVRHMASSLAVEWAKKGVRVNTLRCATPARWTTLNLTCMLAAPVTC